MGIAGPQPTIEELKLELERLTYSNERTRTYLEHLRIEVGTVHESAERSRDMAFGFAKMALQTMFLLNGGALIAFPAFAQLVGNGFSSHVTTALISICGFAAGLVFISTATLLAYLAMDADKESSYRREGVLTINLTQSYHPDCHNQAQEELRTERQSDSEKYHALGNKLRTGAIVLGFLSLAAFIGGTICAGYVLSAATPGTKSPTQASAISAT